MQEEGVGGRERNELVVVKAGGGGCERKRIVTFQGYRDEQNTNSPSSSSISSPSSQLPLLEGFRRSSISESFTTATSIFLLVLIL